VLAIAAIPMLLIALAIRATSHGGAFFIQSRVGRNGRLFRIYKFRTMATRPAKLRGMGLTRAGDERVTPLGRVLRKLKLDELPQFYNVLRGDMSLVGPRPKLPEYEPLRNMPYRPGITGAATLLFRREEELLRSVPPDQLDDFYQKRIKTVKARVDVCAMCRATPMSDLKILAATAGLRNQQQVSIVLDAPAD
jgi:lipopolysaccharide/colanic/teichoic acid biosynthesis glycosyltransferase